MSIDANIQEARRAGLAATLLGALLLGGRLVTLLHRLLLAEVGLPGALPGPLPGEKTYIRNKITTKSFVRMRVKPLQWTCIPPPPCSPMAAVTAVLYRQTHDTTTYTYYIIPAEKNKEAP